MSDSADIEQLTLKAVTRIHQFLQNATLEHWSRRPGPGGTEVKYGLFGVADGQWMRVEFVVHERAPVPQLPRASPGERSGTR